MLLAALFAVLLLASCNINQDGGKKPILNETENQSQLGADNETQQPPGDSGDGGNPVYRLTAQQVQDAVGMLSAGLEQPDATVESEDLIAKLPTASAALFKDAIAGQVGAGAQLDRHQLAEWLAVDPAAARPQIAAGVATGNAQCMMALIDNAAVGRELIDGLQVEPQDTQTANLCLDLLRTWGGAQASDEPLLHQLAQSEDKTVEYRAAGYLLALGAGGDAEFDLLKSAVLARGKDWIGAIEGIKISGDPRFADVLVQLVSETKLNDEGAPAEDETEPAASTPELLAAYAVSYLPGEQAEYMRKKLLNAASPELRWHARLGELLHGDAQPWNDAVDAEGLGDQKLWVVLEPPEALHNELVPFYAQAAQSDNAMERGKAALQLSRYNGVASAQQLASILEGLIAQPAATGDGDNSGGLLVQRQALITVGELKLTQLCPQVLEIMHEAGADASCRRAAAFCLLSAGTLPSSASAGQGSDG